MAKPLTRTRRHWWRRIVLALLLLAAADWLRRRRSSGALRRRYLQASTWLNLRVDWWTLPGTVALLNFAGMRGLLRARNLHDTQTLPAVDPDVERPPDRRWLRARSPDGTYNDLGVPAMGSAHTRFGRNVPLESTVFDESRLLTPSPRTVSRELLTRGNFLPATSLNLLAAAWLQFQLHDWVSHGPNDSSRLIEIPLPSDDP